MMKITKEYPNQRFILEGWHVYPKDIQNLFKKQNIKMICLGYPNADVDETLKLLRANEQENSYTKRMPNEKVKELIAKHINYSKILKKQCEENSIMFFDTSKDREKILENIVNYLIK